MADAVDLLPELLDIIQDEIADPADQGAFSRTCKRARGRWPFRLPTEWKSVWEDAKGAWTPSVFIKQWEEGSPDTRQDVPTTLLGAVRSVLVELIVLERILELPGILFDGDLWQIRGGHWLDLHGFTWKWANWDAGTSCALSVDIHDGVVWTMNVWDKRGNGRHVHRQSYQGFSHLSTCDIADDWRAVITAPARRDRRVIVRGY